MIRGFYLDWPYVKVEGQIRARFLPGVGTGQPLANKLIDEVEMA